MVKLKNHKLKCWSIITSVVMLIGIVIVQRGWSESGDDCVESGTPVVLRLVADCGKTYKYGQEITVEMQDPDFSSSVSQKIILPSSSVDGTAKSYEFTGSAFVKYCVKVTDTYNLPVEDTYDAVPLMITMKVPTPTPVSTATPIPTATPVPTATPIPTATPVPTATSVPTATPVITATPATPTPVSTATPIPTATPVITATPATPTPATMPTAISTATPATACSLHLSSNSVTVKINNTESVDASGLPTGGDFESSRASSLEGSEGVSVVAYKDGTAKIIIFGGYNPCNFDVEIIYSTSDCSVSDTINVEVVASTKPTPIPTPRPTPDLSDTDDDGLCNYIEERIGTDIDNPDSDYDGWYDGDEHWSQHDPLDPEDHPTEEELEWPQCPGCGRHYNPEEEYTECPYCGYSFSYAPEEYSCPSCGATVTTEDYKCPECGKVLIEE